MTEERERYLASIGKEERAIRQAISDCRRMIKHGKEGIGKYKNRSRSFRNILLFENFKDDVRFNKIYLKRLKKQLPAPKERTKTTFGVYPYQCPSCKGVLETHCTVHYCMHCGQKLR